MLPPQQERRAYPRFKLRHPAILQVRSGTTIHPATTEDISVRGFRLITNSSLSLGCKVEVDIRMATGTLSKNILVGASGTVVRVEPGATANEFAVAVECDRPLITR